MEICKNQSIKDKLFEDHIVKLINTYVAMYVLHIHMCNVTFAHLQGKPGCAIASNEFQHAQYSQ